MAVPIMRLYNFALPTALNTFALATDSVTTLSVQQLNKDNAIIDYVNSPDLAAGILHQTRLLINNLEAGPTFFSSNSSAASAGRTVPGPLPISVGELLEENKSLIMLVKQMGLFQLTVLL